eukprot:TRINITY_DN2203_c0_g2_i1.p1 TRINITY_DN2203_c0_g2~~TRINITY_DN2203_c0_g2_i1.p1  ORF type:complete len:343 (+),score=30.43 TRINITY_DN2203_c0_g2_i1:62-1090(+)
MPNKYVLALLILISIGSLLLNTKSVIYSNEPICKEDHMSSQGQNSIIDQDIQSDTKINLKHLVITKFRVLPKDRHNATLHSTRLDLLETFTLPSLQHQTVKDFNWVIIARKDMPQEFYAKRFSKLFSYSWIKIVMISNIAECAGTNWLYNYNVIPKNHSYTHILTTRLDEDDPLSRDYIEKSRRLLVSLIHIRKVPFSMVSFSDGALWYPNSSTTHGTFKHHIHAFYSCGLSYLLPVEYNFTVITTQHSRDKIGEFLSKYPLTKKVHADTAVLGVQDPSIISWIYVRTSTGGSANKQEKMLATVANAYEYRYDEIKKIFNLDWDQVQKLNTIECTSRRMCTT